MKHELEVLKQYTPDEMQVITSTIAKNATPEELGLFLYRCKLLNLNPLKPGQIHFMKYSANAAPTIVVGIEGFRSIAARTGKLTGIKRGAIKDDKGALVGAWAEVYRSDWKECAREEVPLNEYNKGNSTWKSMPETMIKKVAEAAALRMAFPDDLGGVYESAEMDQATPAEAPPAKQVTSFNSQPVTTIVEAKPITIKATPHINNQPNVEAQFAQASEASQETFDQFVEASAPAGYAKAALDPNYVITFGKHKGQTIEAVGIDVIGGYVGFLENKAKGEGKPIQGQVLTFIQQYEARLK